MLNAHLFENALFGSALGEPSSDSFLASLRPRYPGTPIHTFDGQHTCTCPLKYQHHLIVYNLLHLFVRLMVADAVATRY